MKRLLMLAGVCAALSLPTSAHAQQMPTQVPMNSVQTGGGSHHVTSHQSLPPMRFPVTAARYEIFVSSILESLRKVNGRGPLTAGTINKLLLEIRDCASRIEANGYVTSQEAAYCGHQMKASFREAKVAAFQAYHP